MQHTAPGSDSVRSRNMLFLSVFVIATCGLIYELVAGALASYLMGDSVRQFSTIIGAYLFSMGVGSWLSKYLDGDLLRWFIRIELLAGLVGGVSAPCLFVLFGQVSSFPAILYAWVGLTGILVGIEIPLLMRIMQSTLVFKDLVARIFTFDYSGALLASVIFPLLLVPYLGLVRTSLLFGLFNTGVACYLLFNLQETRKFRKGFLIPIGFVTIVLLSGFVYAEKILSLAETVAYQDNVIHAVSTPYQRIAITRNKRDIRLFLNGNLQFSSADEYRYHEALVHPIMGALTNPHSVLVLGGGDGLAVSQILKYMTVDSITLVDLDPEMTRLFRTSPMLTALNHNSLTSPKVHIINTDAFNFIKSDTHKYDAIIIDFPDPGNFSLGKLYTTRFYEELHHLLQPGAVFVVQSTSPFVAPKSFWCVAHTMSAAGFITIPYHAYVPSFGEWGYVMGMEAHNWKAANHLPQGLRFVSPATINDMLYFPPDMAEVPTGINRLNDQLLVNYFEHEWAPYTH